jgi:uncharacterized membrane protein
MAGRRVRSGAEDRPGVGRQQEAISRIEAFSDGVMAIAITLLVLQLAVPGPQVGDAGLGRALLEQGPHFFAYLLSFAVIGRFWVVHHSLFRYIRRYDAPFLTLNLAFLLTIAFLPYPSDLLGEHGQDRLAVIVYAAGVAAASLASGGLWIYATRRHRLVDPALPEVDIRHYRRRAVSGGIVFLVSIPLAFIEVWLAFAAWLAILPIVRMVLTRRYRTERDRTETAEAA